MPNSLSSGRSPAAPPEAAPKTLESVLQQVHFNCRSGQWAEAITNCEAIIAQCNQQIQKAAAAAEAKAVAKAAKAEAADLAEAQTVLSKTTLATAEQLKQSGDLSGSLRAYLQSIQQAPLQFTAYNRLRYNLMRYDIPSGDPLLQAVADTCEQVITQHPHISPARITLGYALTKLGQRDAAIDCYRQIGDLVVRRKVAGQAIDPSAQVSLAAEKTEREDAAPSEPNFMIIGAEKSGTTSLFQYLRQHPAVMPSIEKEIDFFDMEYEQGLDWYLAHFPRMPAAPKWITGETSANYLYSDVAPERVFRHFPNIQLAVILRNPVDRTISRYSMMVRNGAEKRSLARAVQTEIELIEGATKAGEIPWPVLNRCRHVGNSLYYYHLKRWLAFFPQKQLLTLDSESLFTKPDQTLNQLYRTLGLGAYSQSSYPKHNSGQYPSADRDVRQMLAAFFAPHTRKLEALLEQTFDWNQR